VDPGRAFSTIARMRKRKAIATVLLRILLLCTTNKSIKEFTKIQQRVGNLLLGASQYIPIFYFIEDSDWRK
jgi:hypothetical protein